jgi:hypothetical protein
MTASLTAPQTGQKRKSPPGDDAEGTPENEDENFDDRESSDEDGDDDDDDDDDEKDEEGDTTLPGEWLAASFADLQSPALRDVLSPTPCMPAVPRTQPKPSQPLNTPSTRKLTDSDWCI